MAKWHFFFAGINICSTVLAVAFHNYAAAFPSAGLALALIQLGAHKCPKP